MNPTTTPPPELDQATLAVLRDALGSARAGRIDQACEIAERGLADGGDPAALNALLGALHGELGHFEVAVRHLEVAHQAHPADVRIATNLANALTSIGDLPRALEVASAELAYSDPSLQLARTRGYLGQSLGQPEIAVEAYDRVVKAFPADWASWNNLGNARVAAGDVRRGIADLERAVAMVPDSPPARMNLARAHRAGGNFARAEEVLRQMADDFPSDPLPLKGLYDLLVQGERENELLPVLDRAIERDPTDLGLLLARAAHLGLQLEIDQAEAGFRHVLDRDPTNEEAFVGLAVVYEHGRPAALAALADEAERVSIGAGAINLLRAFSERRAKRYAEAAEALGRIGPNFEALRVNDLQGQMLEKLGDYDDAFAAFERMNQIQSEDPTQPLARASAFREDIRQRIRKTTASWIDSWEPGGQTTDERSPVFLVGFPRSGTTLLDTLLMGHPNVVVLEERPVVLRAEEELGGFEALPTLDDEALRKFRERYFELASEYADLPQESLLVDKSPMLLNRAATIHRLFPNARFILALRHPADVLLSCFVSNFRLNSAMTSFLRLDTGAELYDLTFRNWEHSRSLMPLNVHEIVYERLVEDPQGVLRPLIEWLGLDWHDDLLDHTTTAQQRGTISTASYAQVTEPIYRGSVDRWRHYRKHLEPILPVLKPWIEKFGYSL